MSGHIVDHESLPIHDKAVGQSTAQMQTGGFNGLQPKTAPDEVLQHIQIGIEQQHIRGVHLQLFDGVKEQDGQTQIQIETGTDGMVNGVQRGQPLHLQTNLRFGPLAVGDILGDNHNFIRRPAIDDK